MAERGPHMRAWGSIDGEDKGGILRGISQQMEGTA